MFEWPLKSSFFGFSLRSWPLLVRWHISPFSIEGRLILTLFLSAFACCVIIILDHIEDAAEQDERIVTHKIVGESQSKETLKLEESSVSLASCA